MKNSFVELNRTFGELSPNAKNLDSENWRHFFGEGTVNWSTLIQHYRVVILSEAGSGKTEEIRNVTRQLIANKKYAFFLRLEHMVEDFEIAFEEGTFEKFSSWKNGSLEEGWIFLDSVDESRLRNPLDFERAIRRLALTLGPSKQRAHIVITGRISGWRETTDLALCEQQLPFQKTHAKELPSESSSDFDDEIVSTDHIDDASNFKIYAINELSSSQVEIFAKAQGVLDVQAFIDEIERAEAGIHTKRPLDLEELVQFWQIHKRIGSRLELMRNSIDQRLKERDENRAQSFAITSNKLRDGAQIVAAASLLLNEQTIQVPDGSNNSKGIPIRELLPDWNEVECTALLARPIFDKAIYGTVRFYHRSVKEYLAAEWFSELLKNNSSRLKIESLFFKKIYDVSVITPRLRPILPWLALLDDKVRNRISANWPEVFFEGGDPSQLPLDLRKNILKDLCEMMLKGEPCRSIQARDAIQRFASPDLSEIINQVLEKSNSNPDLQWFLLRMIWQGQIIELLPIARSIAIATNTDVNSRIAAISVVTSFGTDEDVNQIRINIGNSAKIDRNVLAELIDGTSPSVENFEWFFKILSKVNPKKKYHSESLTYSVEQWIKRADQNALNVFINIGAIYLEKKPVIERRHCEVSVRYFWLTNPLAIALERLIKVRDAIVFSDSSLSILRKLPVLKNYDPEGYNPSKIEFHTYVSNWVNLKMALFWHMINEERAWEKRKKGAPVVHYAQSGLFSSYVSFAEVDFEIVLTQISSQLLEDNQLVSLTLAHAIYVEAGKTAKHKKDLLEAVSSNVQLKSKLKELLAPIRLTPEQKKLNKDSAYWEKQTKARVLKNLKQREKDKRFLKDNIDSLRSPKVENAEDILKSQAYLFDQMRNLLNKDNDRSPFNWQILADEFGMDVARAYRDGVVAYWRRYNPITVSEGLSENSYWLPLHFGLLGLAIEANEVDCWQETLSSYEAVQAFKYALNELNGFPFWLPKLYSKFKYNLSKLVWNEIYYELTSNVGVKKDSTYLLYDVSYSGEWMWEELSPHVLNYLEVYDVPNLKNLGYLISVLQGSNVISDKALSDLAKKKALTSLHLETHASWVAVWTGVDPKNAISYFENYLNTLKDKKVSVTTSVIYINQLIGGRHSGRSNSRREFRTPEFLKQLFMLMTTYIKPNEDTDRANRGVYSPSIRDDAQDGRGQLYELLNEMSGKEAYQALLYIAKEYPVIRSRPWFMLKAISRAALDSEITNWKISQVRDFYLEQESTPSCHKELFDLAVMRLLDLKSDWEDGDYSVASSLKLITQETEIRKFINSWCRDSARGRYSIPPEEELADAKRPDLRWHGNGFDAPVPTELKLADNWGGDKLLERLENQLCGDYLRDCKSSNGIFLLVYRGSKKTWTINGKSVSFEGLLISLQQHWLLISSKFPNVDEIEVIGIDLTKRNSEEENK